jgi:hypothetical protein
LLKKTNIIQEATLKALLTLILLSLTITSANSAKCEFNLFLSSDGVVKDYNYQLTIDFANRGNSLFAKKETEIVNDKENGIQYEGSLKRRKVNIVGDFLVRDLNSGEVIAESRKVTLHSKSINLSRSILLQLTDRENGPSVGFQTNYNNSKETFCSL